MDFLTKLGEKQNMPNGKTLALRLFVIGFLILIFIFPSFLVQELVKERSQRQASAVGEVSSKWGESQTVIGPILVVPYYPYGPVAQFKGTIDPANLRLAYFVPESLDIKGNVTSELRARGIYKVPLYEGDLTVQGAFMVSDLGNISLSADKMLWNQAYLAMGGLDLGGLKDQLVVNWNGANKKFVTGDKSKLFQSEVTAPAGLGTDAVGKKIPFSLKLAVRGSSNLFFVPVGKETTIALTSDWPSPSFDGAFLPTAHEVKNNGFTASWKVLDVNRNIPAAWTDTATVSLGSAIQSAQNGSLREDDYNYNNTNYNLGELGVRFYLPVDIYQKNTRSAKYALAVIGLVFLIYFLVEAASRRRVNPLQYILVGLALCIFYTLLLSLSEYIAFGLAYLVASAAVVAMIGLFTKSILKSWHLGFITAAVLVFLYGFIFILLQSKDYTLLIGSIGLFIILGVIMYFSRYINWYGEDKGDGAVSNV
jgi:inner membrane protein